MPVLAIAAHIPRTEIGGQYFQETHPQELFRACSVYCELVSVPEQLPACWTSRCARRWRGAGSPWSWSLARCSSRTRHATRSQRRYGRRSPVVRPDQESLAAAAQVLNSASRVTIVAGAGCAGAHDQLIALAGALKAPVVHAFRGKEFVEYDNPTTWA